MVGRISVGLREDIVKILLGLLGQSRVIGPSFSSSSPLRSTNSAIIGCRWLVFAGGGNGSLGKEATEAHSDSPRTPPRPTRVLERLGGRSSGRGEPGAERLIG